jgi:hypothetical protein
MLVEFISKMFDHSFKEEWYETYWTFDLHGTIIKPTYKGTEMIYYPYAKEVLQILTKRPDIKMILWTSSFLNEVEEYLQNFEKENIHFDAVNKNPGISSKNGNFGYYEEKFYFNVLFDDKAGFSPDREWRFVYDFLISCEAVNFFPNPDWTTKH